MKMNPKPTSGGHGEQHRREVGFLMTCADGTTDQHDGKTGDDDPNDRCAAGTLTEQQADDDRQRQR